MRRGSEQNASPRREEGAAAAARLAPIEQRQESAGGGAFGVARGGGRGCGAVELIDTHQMYQAVNTSAASDEKEESTSFSRSDRYMLGFLGFLVVLVVAQMVIRDLDGPQIEACDGDVISKHLHCVSRNGTRTFAEFLAVQGAKKEHPYYAAEREAQRARLRGSRSSSQNRTEQHARPSDRPRQRPPTRAGAEEDVFLDPRVTAGE